MCMPGLTLVMVLNLFCGRRYFAEIHNTYKFISFAIIRYFEKRNRKDSHCEVNIS